MIIKKIAFTKGTKEVVKTSRFFGIAVLVCLLALMGSFACKNAQEDLVSEEDSGLSLKEGIIEFEGTAKVALGKYLYVPEAQGFDIVVQGALSSGDISTLIDKEIRGKGEFSPEYPSILVATTIEMKDELGAWSSVFTKMEEVVLDDYLGLQERDGYQLVEGLVYNDNKGWEGLEKIKINGLLEEAEGAYKIYIFDESDNRIGSILVDSISDFAIYYVQKLGLFERFWFYLTVKDTVEWSVRRTSSELFHADVHFAGLF